MSNQLVGVNRRVHPYVLLFLARIDCYNNLVLLKNPWDRSCLGQGKCLCDPCEVWSKSKDMLVPEIGRPCTESLQFHNVFFWQFHGLYSKENQCSGWMCQRWLPGYTKEYGHNAMVCHGDPWRSCNGATFWVNHNFGWEVQPPFSSIQRFEQDLVVTVRETFSAWCSMDLWI